MKFLHSVSTMLHFLRPGGQHRAIAPVLERDSALRPARRSSMTPVDCQAIMRDRRESDVPRPRWRIRRRLGCSGRKLIHLVSHTRWTLVPTTPSNSSLAGEFTPAYSGAACGARRRRRCMSLASLMCRPLHCGTKVLLSWCVGREVYRRSRSSIFLKPTVNARDSYVCVVHSKQYQARRLRSMPAPSPSVSGLWEQLALPPLTLPVW